MLTKNATSEAAIFGRVVLTQRKKLTPAIADYLLHMGFAEEDRVRMHELAVKNQEGNLTPEEREELENFVSIGDLLALLKAKVRAALKKASA